MSKRERDVAPTNEPSIRQDEHAGPIVQVLTIPFRSSDGRVELRRQTCKSDDVIEESLSIGAARDGVMNSAAAYLVEQTPRVLELIVSEALQGNLPACKLALELAQLGDYVKALNDALDAADGGTELKPLDIGLIENLRKQIARLPDKPDPRVNPRSAP